MAAGVTAISRGAGRVSKRLDRLSERSFALLVSVPSLLLVALVVLPPTIAVFALSLFRIELGKDDRTPFVGLNNFLVRLPADQVVMDAIPRTIIFAAAITAVTLPLALVTALVLNRRFRGDSVFFMALLVPWAISSIVTGIFWRLMFDVQFGIVNGILIGLGVMAKPINWLENTGVAIIIAVVATAAGDPCPSSRSSCLPPCGPSRRPCTGRPRWTAPPAGRPSGSSPCPPSGPCSSWWASSR